MQFWDVDQGWLVIIFLSFEFQGSCAKIGEARVNTGDTAKL